MKSRIQVCLVGFALISLLSGCKVPEKSKLTGAQGKYDGFVVRRQSGHSEQIFAHATITAPTGSVTSLDIKVAGDEGHAWEFNLAAISPKDIKLASDSIGTTPAELLAESKDCFHTAQGAALAVRLCYDGNELSIDDTSGDNELLLVLDKHDDKDTPVLEKPRSYTVAEILDRAKNQSFTSELQFEAAVQSHLNSTNAHLQLLPHVSFNDVLSLVSMVTFNWMSLLHMVGDLAPFLMPQNWVAADAAKFQSDADYHAWLTMKADSGNIASGLAYALLRDQESLQRLNAYEGPVTELRDTILEREKMGIAAPHSSDGLTEVLNAIKESELLLDQAISQEFHSLAQSAGFVNPDAVQSVVAPTGLVEAIESPETVHLDDAKTIAVDRSPELKQLDDLVRVAKDNSLTRDLFWLDPNGGGEGLGFGFPSYLKAGKVKIKELEIQRQQLQETLLQKIEDAAKAMDTAAQTYQVAKSNLEVQTERVDGLKASLDMGINIDPTQLQVALQDELKSETDLINAKYEYAVASGTLSRMLLNGAYLDIESMIVAGRPLPKP